MIELRPYQRRGVEAARAHVVAGRNRIVLCLPTGGGKTVVAASIIQSARRNFDAKVLFVAHRKEILDQTVAQLAKWGVTEVGVIRADDARTNRLLPVQVASIQSLGRRSAPPADIVFIDEAHRGISQSYVKLIDLYPKATILGLTATPCRADGKSLGDVFQEMEIIATYGDLIEDGFIVAPRCFGGANAPDLSNVHTVAGDYVLNELEDEMMKVDVLGDVLSEYQARAEGRRTLIFATTVKHSKAIEEQFLKAGVRIAHVDGETPQCERDVVGQRLRDGDLDVVVNCSVYGEGWDEPSVKCVMLARPTKSLTLFMQMCGRGLRPWNNVTPVLLDLGGNLDRHGFPHEDRAWSLSVGVQKPARKHTKCIVCRAFIRHYPCPECGHAPPVTPKEVRVASDVQLEEKTFSDPRLVFFNRQIEVARGRGYKPGYAGAKFKEEFGQWPPWSWSQRAKDVFASDSDWRARNIAHEADRARWKKHNVEETQETPYESDDDFLEFLR
jgi:superfamily II DNA or RNA helicase